LSLIVSFLGTSAVSVV